jgi:hypothetical protein
VKRVRQSERRHEVRLPQNLEVIVTRLPQLGSPENGEARVVTGHLQNISRDGVCLVTSSPIGKSSVLRCEIPMGDAPLRIATLMQVRWTRRQATAPDTFISGLEALL